VGLSAAKSEAQEKGGHHVEEQQSFFDEEGAFPDPPEPAPEKSLDERFEEFKEAHPDVLVLFRRFACELRAAGHERAGSKLIWERIRYEKMTSAHRNCEDGFALNNNFTSRVARWLMEVDPSFIGWFETRKLKS
jgi:hypothetical protein